MAFNERASKQFTIARVSSSAAPTHASGEHPVSKANQYLSDTEAVSVQAPCVLRRVPGAVQVASSTSHLCAGCIAILVAAVRQIENWHAY